MWAGFEGNVSQLAMQNIATSAVIMGAIGTFCIRPTNATVLVI